MSGTANSGSSSGACSATTTISGAMPTSAMPTRTCRVTARRAMDGSRPARETIVNHSSARVTAR